ncbi:MAG: alpha/beta hydrolase [Armatimonadaceae bacterium]
MFVFLTLGGMVGWAGLTGGITYSFLHPPPTPLSAVLDDALAEREAVTFSSANSDQIRLSGWLVPASGSPRKASQGVIILAHGRSENRTQMLPHARYLSQAGFTCLLFDFRGWGESERAVSTVGWNETEDVLGAIAYLRQRPDTRNLPIGALGVSMGGAAVLRAAAESGEIRAVVTDCAYATLTRAIQQRFRAVLGPLHYVFSVPVQLWGRALSGVDSERVSPLEAVRPLNNCSLLFIHSQQDRTILLEDSRLLYDAAPEPKDSWWVAGVAHTHAYGKFPDEYAHRVIRHFQCLTR